MNDALTKEGIKYMISRLIENMEEATKEAAENDDDYSVGRKVAYYEMLDILKTELYVRDQNLKEFGLDVNLESKIK